MTIDKIDPQQMPYVDMEAVDIINTLIGSAITSPPYAPTGERFYAEMNGTTQFITMPPVILSGDYLAEAKIIFDGSSTYIPAGNSGSFNSRIRVLGDGSINWRPTLAASSGLDAPAGSVSIIGENTITADRVGNVGTIYVNGNSVISGTVPLGDAVFDVSGRSSTGYQDGVTYDLFVEDAGEGIRSYSINDNNSVIVDTISGADGSTVGGITWVLQ